MILDPPSSYSAMFLKLGALLVFFIGLAASKDCLECICEAESDCTPKECNMDEGSLSCGFYQLKLDYYKDCGKPNQNAGESDEDAWKRCAMDKDCSIKCVNAYMDKYKDKCKDKGDCERTARQHNGGPDGCGASRTDWYWNKVKACCGC
ncbi:hypothetical protein L596_011705 [Steinernema carpocapsae]|uniref:lysozyme n=2 Tax=Steinernema carpocapsae TaxID=34508 RepID=A0A4U5NUT4_STECR|nr:hypothetical protein L596_011705 [Steinernema carpocapsae]